MTVQRDEERCRCSLLFSPSLRIRIRIINPVMYRRQEFVCQDGRMLSYNIVSSPDESFMIQCLLHPHTRYSYTKLLNAKVPKLKVNIC